MSTLLRSDGWSVRPSFVPNGATAPVTLLCDELGLTQLAGEPPVAWQTPWTEMTNLQLVRFAGGVALIATVDGVRYCWRKRERHDYESWRELVVAHGGSVERRRRRAGVAVVAVVVLAASLAGGLGAVLNRATSGAGEIAAASAVNLTAKDLPTDWTPTTTQGCSIGSALSCLFPSSTAVITSTTGASPVPKATSLFARVSAIFQRCLGVTPASDRVYGAAGQQPDYQVTSPVFGSASFGGIQVAATTQYYRATSMVRRDTAEMSRPNFGPCFVTSQDALLRGAAGKALPRANVATDWRPVTFVGGWSRGAVASITLPGVVGPLYLVEAVTTAGHFESTLGALVAKWPASRTFLNSLVGVLLSRMTSGSSAPA